MTIRRQLIEKDRQWTQLLVTLAEGRPEGIQSLERMDSSAFYFFYKAWKQRNETLAASHK